jgi:hypothetical protein
LANETCLLDVVEACYFRRVRRIYEYNRLTSSGSDNGWQTGEPVSLIGMGGVKQWWQKKQLAVVKVLNVERATAAGAEPAQSGFRVAALSFAISNFPTAALSLNLAFSLLLSPLQLPAANIFKFLHCTAGARTCTCVDRRGKPPQG